MATTTSITTTYAGEFKQKYIKAALLAGDTLANELIMINPGVKYKEPVKVLGGLGSALVDATCDFTSTGTVTLTERVIQPKELQVNMILCKKDFRSDWEAMEMGISVYDNLPPTFQDFFMQTVVEQVAADVETSIWHGASGNTGEFNGICTILVAEGGYTAVTGTTITSANVQAEIGKVVDAIPAALYSKKRKDLQIYVASNIFKAYIRSLGGFGAAGLGAAGVNTQGNLWYNGQPLYYDGIPVVEAVGMENNKMVCTYKENLWFGTGLFDDMTEAKLIDTSETLGDQNVRVILRMTATTQIGILSDVVGYGLS